MKMPISCRYCNFILLEAWLEVFCAGCRRYGEVVLQEGARHQNFCKAIAAVASGKLSRRLLYRSLWACCRMLSSPGVRVSAASEVGRGQVSMIWDRRDMLRPGVVQLWQGVHNAKGGHGTGHGCEGPLQHAALRRRRDVPTQDCIWPHALAVEGICAVGIFHDMAACSTTVGAWP